MKLTKTSKIGILTVFCLTILIWGINFLKGRDIFRTEKVFIARYKNVGGLEASTLVTLNGLKIGYVREIYFAEDLSGDLITKIAIHNDFPLPVGTTAEIASNDLLGSKVVKINLGKSTQLLQPNDTLKTSIEADIMSQVSEQIAPIKAKAERLIDNLDTIVEAASKMLDTQSQRNLAESFRQISATMKNLEMISGNLNEVISSEKKNLASTISNFSETSEHFKINSAKLGHITDNLSQFSDSLAKLELNNTINHLNSSMVTLQAILCKIDTANGTMGLLINDPRLYQNLNYTSENLNRLLVDLRQNPKRYVHFSALNLGRNISITPPDDDQLDENITFRIQLLESVDPISLTTPIFKNLGEITEIKSGNRFYYYSKSETSFSEINIKLKEIQLAFPEAFLKAYRSGKEISIKNALKTVKK